MINNLIRGIASFIILVLLQVWVLNNIYLFRIASPLLYVYFILKLPLGISRCYIIFFSFLIGLVIDMFSNTPGMHAAACTFIGFLREPVLRFCVNRDLESLSTPSYSLFGLGGFFRYALILIAVHHILLYVLEAATFVSPLFLTVRVIVGIALTLFLVCTVELFEHKR